MADDVILNKNKATPIERCLQHSQDECAGNEHHLFASQIKQDAVILNL
jgi:hypothetical protein